MAKENKYEFKSEDVQRVANRSESTVRKTFFDKLKGYSTEKGPVIKMLPDSRVYQINPYFMSEGSAKKRRSLQFCFLLGWEFTKDPKEIEAQFQLKRLVEGALKLSKEKFIGKLDDAFANGGENLDAIQDFPHLRQPTIRVWELLKGGSYKTAPVSPRKRKVLPHRAASEKPVRPSGSIDPATLSKEEFDERMQQAELEMEEHYQQYQKSLMKSEDESSELEDEWDEDEFDDPDEWL